MCVNVLPCRSIFALLILGLAGTYVAAKDLDMLLFGSLDAGRATFSTSGAKIGLDSVEREGVLGLLTVGEGVRRERQH